MYLKQNIKDFFYSFAKKSNKDLNTYPYKISLQYKNIDNYLSISEKQKNQLTKIEGLINNIIIKPNQIFSFWKTIKDPYVMLKDPELSSLLNLISSSIYYLSMLSGLSIIERHHYNFDYFSNGHRIFPLGADAEVIYKSKDLRIKSNFSFPVKFELKITPQFIDISIVSSEKIVTNEVDFNYRYYKNYTEVLTRVNRRTIEVSVYKKHD